MQQSEHIDKLAEALAKAQGAIQNPSKNREVSVQTRTGGAYKFSYATLDNIFDVIRKPLADNGLAFLQTLHTLDDGRLRLVTLLTHSSGQWIKTETPVDVREQGMQALGSAQTYARRYAISSLLGIAADEDDDANAAEGNAVTSSHDRKTTANGKANGNGAAKTAAPKQSAEPDPLREAFVRIRDGIAKAKSAKAVDDLLKASADDLNAIRDKSYAAYEQLAHAAENRKADLAPIAA